MNNGQVEAGIEHYLRALDVKPDLLSAHGHLA